MNRFTTKCDSDEYIVGVTTNGGYDEDAVLEKQYEANQKLGKLEDLLEKYGISDSVNFDYLEKCIQDHDKYGELQEKLEVLEILKKKPFILQKIFENKGLSNQEEYDKKYFWGTITEDENAKVEKWLENDNPR